MSKVKELQAPNPKKSREERIADAKKHFVDFYGKIPAGQFLYLITFSGGTKCYAFNSADESQLQAMAEKAIELSDSGVDVYHAVNSVSVKPTDNERGKETVVSYQTAIVVDIDIQSDAHKSDNLAADFDEAKSFLPFRLKPSKLFNSGYGLHAYYLFDTPLEVTADNREECKRRNNRMLKLVRQLSNGKKIDAVGDLTRVLRTPETVNYRSGKDNPPLCHVVENNDIRYTPSDLDAALNDLLPAQETAEPARLAQFFDPADTPEYDNFRVSRMLDEIRRCICALSQEQWLAFMSAAKNLGVSYATVDEINRCDADRYDEHENLRRWKSLTDPSFDIETLHGLAKLGGYSESDTRAEYNCRADTTADTSAAETAEPVTADTTADKLPPDQRKILFSGDFSDDDYAKKLVHFYGGEFKYLRPDGSWYCYEKGIWRNVGSKNSALFPYANDLARKMEVNATDKDEFKIKMARALKSTAKKANSIAAIQGLSEVFITADDLDNHNELFSVANGVIDLKTGKLYPHAPELMLTQQSPAVYREDATCPDVDKFLADILPDEKTRSALLLYLGYCMTGAIRDHKALFIHGRGRNGKGTLLRLLRRTFGDNYFTTLSKGVVLKSPRLKDNNAPSPELMVLKKRRLAVVDEISDVHDVLDVTTLKTLTGGDTITARQLHTPFEQGGGITPTHHLILSGNRLPTIDNPNDIGLRERLLSVPFNADFSQNPDLNLDDKLSKPDAISRFLLILVSSACKYFTLGSLLESDEMKASREDYLASNDVVKEFAAECCDVGNGEIARKDFEDRLRQYCYENGLGLPRARKDLHEMIMQSLQPLGVVYTQNRTKSNVYRNIKWRQTTY